MVIDGAKVSIDVDRLVEVRDRARELLIKLDREFPYIHLGSSLAALDIINVLIRVMRRSNGDCRDWFILSIGHVAPALYAILAVEGLIPVDSSWRLTNYPQAYRPTPITWTYPT
ncbi:hypothetical protein [Vulcanisaeta sp. JCM 14467]|uniref:hypothetical protein n=1 Tax=Vulcanisaeta sp. JCM 14467 TaxID=1295370 RepID=UPI0006D08199|nr:hypothetical protein [Vulcanisaeta sp. JCM 14467]